MAADSMSSFLTNVNETLGSAIHEVSIVRLADLQFRLLSVFKVMPSNTLAALLLNEIGNHAGFKMNRQVGELRIYTKLAYQYVYFDGVTPRYRLSNGRKSASGLLEAESFERLTLATCKKVDDAILSNGVIVSPWKRNDGREDIRRREDWIRLAHERCESMKQRCDGQIAGDQHSS